MANDDPYSPSHPTEQDMEIDSDTDDFYAERKSAEPTVIDHQPDSLTNQHTTSIQPVDDRPVVLSQVQIAPQSEKLPVKEDQSTDGDKSAVEKNGNNSKVEKNSKIKRRRFSSPITSSKAVDKDPKTDSTSVDKPTKPSRDRSRSRSRRSPLNRPRSRSPSRSPSSRRPRSPRRPRFSSRRRQTSSSSRSGSRKHSRSSSYSASGRSSSSPRTRRRTPSPERRGSRRRESRRSRSPTGSFDQKGGRFNRDRKSPDYRRMNRTPFSRRTQVFRPRESSRSRDRDRRNQSPSPNNAGGFNSGAPHSNYNRPPFGGRNAPSGPLASPVRNPPPHMKMNSHRFDSPNRSERGGHMPFRPHLPPNFHSNQQPPPPNFIPHQRPPSNFNSNHQTPSTGPPLFGAPPPIVPWMPPRVPPPPINDVRMPPWNMSVRPPPPPESNSPGVPPCHPPEHMNILNIVRQKLPHQQTFGMGPVPGPTVIGSNEAPPAPAAATPPPPLPQPMGVSQLLQSLLQKSNNDINSTAPPPPSGILFPHPPPPPPPTTIENVQRPEPFHLPPPPPPQVSAQPTLNDLVHSAATQVLNSLKSTSVASSNGPQSTHAPPPAHSPPEDHYSPGDLLAINQVLGADVTMQEKKKRHETNHHTDFCRPTRRSEFSSKLEWQERIAHEVKLALKPHYLGKQINKNQYKEILKKCVLKVSHSSTEELNGEKIAKLANGYVEKYSRNANL